MVSVLKKSARTAGDTPTQAVIPSFMASTGQPQTDARGQFEHLKCVGLLEMP
jgi:hypothetical protein